MKKAILFILVLNCFYKTMLYSQCISAGPNNGNNFNGSMLPGDQSWSNPSSVRIPDGTYSTGGFVLTLLSTSPTKFLAVSDFQFNIPANAVIKGIQLDIQRLSGGINLLSKIEDNSVRLMKGGVFVGQDKASNNFWPIFNSAYETYGGPYDLWSTTWTPADINAPGFGAAISARLTGLLMLLPSANIDHVRITVNYSIIPTLSLNSSTICAGSSATITATGNNTFSWTPAPGLSTSTGTAVVVNPTVTTTYTVTGSTGSCSNTNTVTINVNPMPVVAVSSSSSNNTICQGDSLGLSTSAVGSYTWLPSSGLSSVSSPSVKASPSVTTTYSVIAVSSDGCSNAMSPATFLVNVNAAPLIHLNSSANTICNGGNTLLSVSGASSYTWSPPTGLSAVTGSSVIASPTITTVYQVTGTSSNGCNALSVGHVTVTVNNSPSLSLSSMAPGNTICMGSSTTLNASGASSYTWSPSTGLSSVTGANIVASPSASIVYTVSASVTGGCVGSISSATLAVTVNNGPTLVPASPANTVICQGSSALLSVNGATSYTWSPATGLSSTNGPAVTANPTVTTIYSVLATASNGCRNELSPTNFTVAVNASPTLSLATSAMNNVICSGTSSTLTASGASSYTWSPATGLNTATGAVVIASPTVTTVYTLHATAPNGCTNVLSPLTFTLNVNSAPTVSISSTSANNSICKGSNISIQASGAGSYTWSPSSSLNTSSGSNVIASPSVTTIYTVTAESASGCSNAMSPQTVTVTVHPVPMITLSSDVIGDSICLGKAITISVSGSAMSYTWSTGTHSQSITVTPTVSTVYDVLSTNSFSCSASGSVYIVVLDPVTLNLTLLNHQVSTSINTPVSYNVSAGAVPNTPGAITITQNPAHGTATIVNGVIVYTPANNYDGTDTVYYRMCDMYCSTVCKTAKLIITIDSDVLVPGVLSPNGDGIHDDFYIRGLSKYPNPELVIFNRWGNVIFSAKPYANDWHGQSSSNSLKISGSDVLDGTYYYLLKLDEDSTPIKGFFEVKRK